MQLEFHKKLRNKTLSAILISTTVAILAEGLTVIFNVPYIISLLVITVASVIINIDKGISLVLTTRYLGNFSSPKILTQIYAANAMMKNFLRAIIGFLGSYLLDITTTANAMVLVGIFLTIISISLISYMKTRLGLKPEQYGENEIYNN